MGPHIEEPPHMRLIGSDIPLQHRGDLLLSIIYEGTIIKHMRLFQTADECFSPDAVQSRNTLLSDLEACTRNHWLLTDGLSNEATQLVFDAIRRTDGGNLPEKFYRLHTVRERILWALTRYGLINRIRVRLADLFERLTVGE